MSPISTKVLNTFDTLNKVIIIIIIIIIITLFITFLRVIYMQFPTEEKDFFERQMYRRMNKRERRDLLD